MSVACLLVPGALSPLATSPEGPVLEAALAMARTWPVDPLVVVIGRDSEEALDAIDFTGAVVAVDEDWEEGSASPLRAGLDALQRLFPDCDAVVIALGEGAAVPEGTVTSLLSALAESTRQAAIPRYRYATGLPIVVMRRLWERLMSLEGDQSPVGLLSAHPDWVVEVHIDALPPGTKAASAT